MEMHQVRYFLAAARTLNFTRAASECNVSQPSLTRAIQKLEDEFGGQLFRRERSLTHLTELGRQVIPHLERTFEAAQAARNLARGIGRDELAAMTLGVAGNICPELRSALAEVTAGLPGFQLSLVNADATTLIEDMLKGAIDASVLSEPREVHERLDRIELARRDYVVIVSDATPLARATECILQDLGSLRWIEGERDIADEFRGHCNASGIEPDFRHSAGSEADLVDLVACGMGAALVAETTALAPNVVRLNIEGLAISRATVFVTVSGRKRSTATEALCRAIRAGSWVVQ